MTGPALRNAVRLLTVAVLAWGMLLSTGRPLGALDFSEALDQAAKRKMGPERYAEYQAKKEKQLAENREMQIRTYKYCQFSSKQIPVDIDLRVAPDYKSESLGVIRGGEVVRILEGGFWNKVYCPALDAVGYIDTMYFCGFKGKSIVIDQSKVMFPYSLPVIPSGVPPEKSGLTAEDLGTSSGEALTKGDGSSVTVSDRPPASPGAGTGRGSNDPAGNRDRSSRPDLTEGERVMGDIARAIRQRARNMHDGPVTIRGARSLDSEPLGELQPDGDVGIISNDGEWSEIILESGQQGYVRSYYLGLDSRYNRSVAVRHDKPVTLRRTRSVGAEGVVTVRPRALVRIIHHEGDWSKVLVDGKTGYIRNRYLDEGE